MNETLEIIKYLDGKQRFTLQSLCKEQNPEKFLRMMALPSVNLPNPRDVSLNRHVT